MSEAKELAIETEKIISMVASDLVNTIGESFVLGHAFLWVRFKVGKKSFETIASYGACSNWSDIQDKLRWACPQITSSWINLD